MKTKWNTSSKYVYHRYLHVMAMDVWYTMERSIKNVESYIDFDDHHLFAVDCPGGAFPWQVSS